MQSRYILEINLPAVNEQLIILIEEGVASNSWNWSYAQNVIEGGDLLITAEKVALISLDALRTVHYYEKRTKIKITAEHHLKLLKLMKKH